MSNPIDLSLVPTDDLIQEVADRYDWAVFMGRKIKAGPSNWETKRRYKGDIYACVGLANNMAHFLNQEIAFNEELTDGKGT